MSKQFLSKTHTLDTSSIQEWHPNIPEENYYLYLTEDLLDSIIFHRDVVAIGDKENKAKALYQLDRLDPTWITDISKICLPAMTMLVPPRIYAYGALSKVVFKDLKNPIASDMVSYIRCYIILKYTTLDESIVRILFESLKRDILCILAQNILGIDHRQLLFLPRSTVEQILIKRDANIPIALDVLQKGKRYADLTGSKNVVYLRRLYKIAKDSDWLTVMDQPPHPLETIFLYYDQYSPEVIAQSCGMVVPAKHMNRIKEYCLANLFSYQEVFTRKQAPNLTTCTLPMLKKAADTEIFQASKACLPYESRAELVTVTHQFMQGTHDKFFLPLQKFYDHAINQTTALGYGLNDQDVIVIGYGNYKSWRPYDITELYQSFHEEDGAIQFRRPEDIRNQFPLEDIVLLEKLVSDMPVSETRDGLIQRIKTGVAQQADYVMGDVQFKQGFRTFSPETQDIIKKILYEILYLGMYMRRWKGPGHPYPIEEKDTHGPAPNVEVAGKIGVVLDLFESLSEAEANFCWSWLACDYTGQEIRLGTRNIKSVLDSVRAGKYCIRMASTIMIGTAYHYLQTLCGEVPPGIPIRNIDHIA